ncbi:MAG TPA: recombinase family protein [Acidimicrobiia bacterium]|nr:recombinase family protein [Acidimicrobiia bacterium]
MRLIGYLRMRAVGGVVEGTGFGEQDRQIRAWAERHGHVVVRTVVDRSSADTPSGLAGAVSAVRSGEADAVLVTSRGRLGVQGSLGVTILAADESAPVAAAGAAERGGWSRAKVGWVVAQWAAIAVAALVAHGVASAASGDAPSSVEDPCVSTEVGVMPCGGAPPDRVLDVAPPLDCDFFDSERYLRPEGVWLCLQSH